MFLVLEGIDGSGKSTQISRLAEWFRGQGQQVVCCSDPGTTPLGLQIRHWLLDSPHMPLAPKAELSLFFAARAQLIAEVIAPARLENQVVISDRFLLSSVVYQGHLGGLDPQTIWQLGNLLFAQHLPDLTIVLDLPARQSLKRTGGTPDRIEARGEEYLERVRQSFLAEAARTPQRIRVVDATAPVDDVANQLQLLIQEHWRSTPWRSPETATEAGTKAATDRGETE